MLTCLRYAVATICFALCVACLGLWWRSTTHVITSLRPVAFAPGYLLELVAVDGVATAHLYGGETILSRKFYFVPEGPLAELLSLGKPDTKPRRFGVDERSVFFPLWYPALIFALASGGALRLGRRFTLRSALIATTVAAVLLGMVVAL